VDVPEPPLVKPVPELDPEPPLFTPVPLPLVESVPLPLVAEVVLVPIVDVPAVPVVPIVPALMVDVPVVSVLLRVPCWLQPVSPSPSAAASVANPSVNFLMVMPVDHLVSPPAQPGQARHA
jgi:hypothetical protein